LFAELRGFAEWPLLGQRSATLPSDWAEFHQRVVDEELRVCNREISDKVVHRVAEGNMQQLIVEMYRETAEKASEDPAGAAEEDGGDGQAVLEPLEDMDEGDLEIVYASLQSGSSLQLEPFVRSNEDIIPMQGSYVLSLGLKCKEYSAAIARTMLVDPVPTVRSAYDTLLEARSQVFQSLVPGTPFGDVYTSAANVVASRSQDLRDRFLDSVGFVTGIEFQDPLMVLSASSTQRVEPGMTFCVSVGFRSSQGGQEGGDPWAIWIADTVVLQEDGTCKIPTDICSCRSQEAVFDIADQDPGSPGELPEEAAEQGVEQADLGENLPAAAPPGTVAWGIHGGA